MKGLVIGKVGTGRTAPKIVFFEQANGNCRLMGHLRRSFPRRQGHGAEQFRLTRNKRPRFSGKADRRSLGLHYFQ